MFKRRGENHSTDYIVRGKKNAHFRVENLSTHSSRFRKPFGLLSACESGVPDFRGGISHLLEKKNHRHVMLLQGQSTRTHSTVK